MTTAHSMLEHALTYASLGAPVVPIFEKLPDGTCACGKDCGRIAKHPRNQHGLRRASTDEKRIRSWWTSWPNAGIALVMGDGIFALDIDGPEGERALSKLVRENGKLPATVEDITPRGGRHLLFAVPDNKAVPPSVCAIGPKLDIRGDGSYIVAPPSTGYRWRKGHEPLKLALAKAPKWLVERARGARTHPLPGPGRRLEEDAARRRSGAGGRSARDFQFCLRLMRQGLSDLEIMAALKRSSEKYRERGDAYVEYTVDLARGTHESHAYMINAPLFNVVRARLEFLDARFGRAARACIVLDLADCDSGDMVTARVVAPSRGYDGEALVSTWRACFPDVDVRAIVEHAWRTAWRARWEATEGLRLAGRVFRVARRGDDVRFIRAELDH